MKAFVSAVLCFLLTCSACFAEQPFADYDKYVEQVMAQWKIPGMALAVVKDGKTSYIKGYGKRSINSEDAVDEHTVFAIASLTKSFTASLAAILVSEKKIKWDDHANQWILDFALNDPWISHECTLRDLLAHRTGINDPGYMWWGSGFDSKEMLKRIRYVRSNGPFRAKYAYNNVFYMVVGESIASAAGKPWTALVKERFFLPLGMNESTVSTKEIEGYANLAKPHKMHNGIVKTIPYRNIDPIAPAGGINSSVHDMARWLVVQLNDGRFGDVQIIPADVLAETQAPQMLMGNPPPISDYLKKQVKFANYGLGWVSGVYRGHHMLWHVGALDGMHSVMGILPEKKSGVVILNNLDQRDESGIFPVFFKTIDALLGLEPMDWNTIVHEEFFQKKEKRRLAAQEADADIPKDTKPTFPLETYAGKYENRVYGPLVITNDGAKLTAKLGIVDGILYHRHYDTFRFMPNTKIGDDSLDFTFVIDRHGKIEAARNEDVGWYTKEYPPKPDDTKPDIKPTDANSDTKPADAKSDTKPAQTTPETKPAESIAPATTSAPITDTKARDAAK